MKNKKSIVVEQYKAFGFYLGFDIDSGVHEIVIKYKQPFWIHGIVISIIFAIIFLILNSNYYYVFSGSLR